MTVMIVISVNRNNNKKYKKKYEFGILIKDFHIFKLLAYFFSFLLTKRTEIIFVSHLSGGSNET